MKLYWSSRSPYVRKVMVVAHETGIAARITTQRIVVSAAKPNADVMAHNPLAKLPTLVLDDGSALYDSRVIAEYLDGLQPESARLFPSAGPARITALRRQALGDGLLDTLLGWLLERIKPEPKQQPAFIDACRLKLDAVLDVLEHDALALGQERFGIGQIAIGTALCYVDFRFAAEQWREGRPQLAAWHRGFAARPSVIATTHVDQY